MVELDTGCSKLAGTCIWMPDFTYKLWRSGFVRQLVGHYEISFSSIPSANSLKYKYFFILILHLSE